MMDDLISKRSATERLIIAKTLLESVLQDMPTAEPSRELIRCKDCKWWLPPHGCNDTSGLIYSTEDAFCSFAERRSDE